MKKLATLCMVISLCTANLAFADNEKEEGKDKKTAKGLEKTGGVPPGQAKKKGQSGDAATESAPAAAPATATAATPAPPAQAPTAAKPASEPVKTAPTSAKTESARPAASPDQKAVLEKHARTINQAAKANEKVALEHISKQAGVTVPELQQQLKYHPDASGTALLVGNLIAKQSGKRFGQIFRERQDGKEWTDIAKAHNVDINPIVKKTAHLAQTMQTVKPQ